MSDTYAVIAAYRDTYPVRLMCDALAVSVRGFNAAQARRRGTCARPTARTRTRSRRTCSAGAERFFSTLEHELLAEADFTSRAARPAISEFITWYNSDRRHSTLGYVGPT